MNPKLKIFALTFVICACFALCQAQDNSVIELGNADILTMVKAKLPTDLILKKIETSRCHFDTFPSVLAELKYKGVPDSIISAMIDATSGNKRASTQRAEPNRASTQQQPVRNSEPEPTAQALNNAAIIKMLRSGISPVVVGTAIKSSTGNYDTSANALVELKQAGATDDIMVLIIQSNMTPGKSPNSSGRITDELTTSFKRLEKSVVTVWSEIGHGTGFIFDKSGLVMTNQHVIGPSDYVAVQFNDTQKVLARVVATDPEKDVAVVWINLAAFPEAIAAPIARTNTAEPSVIEGERVLTIGSPLHQRKVITTGVVSKVEKRAIISDINVNHGNSGGPLFNSLGEVVGITTFGDFTRQGGPGISGIVRIEETFGVIDNARSAMKGRYAPSADYLPVEPTEPYPLDAVKSVVLAEKFETDRYFFGVGEFQVSLLTPPLIYRVSTEALREATKTKNKRTDKDGAVQGTINVLDEFQGWREYVGDYKPVIILRATPNMGESFWGAFGRSFAAYYGVRAQANYRFKTDFYRMKLFCGEREIMPIQPGKVAHVVNESNYFIRAKDATYEGLYTYPAEAINSSCGKVRLEIYSERNPEKANTKTLSEKTVVRIENDFAPYFQKYGTRRVRQ
jgi:S1-C subfamily serine protease